MTFYHHTICSASCITDSVIGNFLDEENEDIVVSSGRILKLLRFERGEKRSSINKLIAVDMYDTIISLSKFRRRGETRDWIVIATQASNITIFHVNAEKMEFELILQHYCTVSFGRKLQGEHLAANSQQQAMFSAALEELKMFWFFQDSSELQDSPEFGSSKAILKIFDDYEKNSLIYDIAFVDIDSENIFVAYLTTPYEELYRGKQIKKKKPNLIFEEVDLRTRRKTKIREMECMDYANSLISVPGQRGVLVCAEDFFAFYSMDSYEIIRCSIPKRGFDMKRGVIFVCSTKCSENLFQKPTPMGSASSEKSIYYLAQTEQGDIFRIQVVVKESVIDEIILHYFITLPVASALCTFKSGFLFVASEFGNHCIYNLAEIEKRARVQPSFSTLLWKGKTFMFVHRNLNIAKVCEIKSLSPIMQMAIEPFERRRSRIYLSTGRASLSTLQISKTDQNITYQRRAKIDLDDEVAIRMWAIRSTESISAEPETLIVVSSAYSTAVYSFERTVGCVMEKIKDPKFALGTETLGCATTGRDVIIQVCPEGVGRISRGRNILLYASEPNNSINKCALNEKFLVLYFEKKELVLHNISENGPVFPSAIPKRLIQGSVTCMLLSGNDQNDQILAVGVSITSKTDPKVKAVNEVHLFKIDVSEISFMCMLKIEDCPNSFLFVYGEEGLESLLVGCKEGRLLALYLTEETTEGEEITTRKKYELGVLGIEKYDPKPVLLLHVPVVTNSGMDAGIMVATDQLWVKVTLGGSFMNFKSEVSSCICHISGTENIGMIFEDQFRVFTLEDFKSEPLVTLPLQYTPKKFSVDSSTGNIIVIQSDNNSYTKETEKKKMEALEKRKEANKRGETNLPPILRIPKSWVSLLGVIYKGENTRELHNTEFLQNQAVFSLCRFQKDDHKLLFTGVVTDFNNDSGCCAGASVHAYKILENGDNVILDLIYVKKFKSATLAMCCYDGKMLIANGRRLALYCVGDPPTFDLNLLCEKKDCVSTYITAIYPVDNRILVSDFLFGISYLVYVPNVTSLYLLQEDVEPIEVTAACILEDNKMVRASKYGNIFIVKLGTLKDRDMSKVIKDDDDEPPFTLTKEEVLGCFYIGEVVTSFQKFKIFLNEPDSVVYTTLSGSIGILSQIPWEKDAKFLNSVYETMLSLHEEIDKNRMNFPFFRDAYRFPRRVYKRENIIDGDFLNEFFKLDETLQEKIGYEIDVEQITTKLERLQKSILPKDLHSKFDFEL